MVLFCLAHDNNQMMSCKVGLVDFHIGIESTKTFISNYFGSGFFVDGGCRRPYILPRDHNHKFFCSSVQTDDILLSNYTYFGRRTYTASSALKCLIEFRYS